MNSAQKLQCDMVRHCYPFSKHGDSFIHSPLVGRDETTNEGMLLTNGALLENLGLLVKEEKGHYSLGPNAQKRTVFMYGDVLSVDFHSCLYDIIFQKITQLGNEEYVRTFLDTHSAVIMQKGHFHQQMHQLGVIYNLFYGGFMQTFQVSSGVKRVNSDPVKGRFQDHE